MKNFTRFLLASTLITLVALTESKLEAAEPPPLLTELQADHWSCNTELECFLNIYIKEGEYHIYKIPMHVEEIIFNKHATDYMNYKHVKAVSRNS